MTTESPDRTVRCAQCDHLNRLPAAGRGKPRCGSCHQPLPWIAESGDADFAEIVERATIPVLVDLWAPWCGPCRMVSPVLEQLANEFVGRVKLVKVNVDVAPELSARFEIRAVPTLLVLSGGQVLARHPGAAPEPALRVWLEKAIADVKTDGGEEREQP
jgi:thioredoxin 2